MRIRILRQSLVVVVALFVTSAACAQTPHGSYEALFQAAIKAITWDFHEDWAFTSTTSGSDGERVGHYDPRQPEGERWTLITIDGRAPTDEESAEYAEKNRDDHFSNNDEGDDGDDNTAIDMVEPGTLQLVEETDEYWLLSFVPTDDGDDDEEDDEVGREVMRSMHGTVKIIKDGEYLAYIDIRNEKPIRPKVGVKMKKFLIHMDFGPVADDGPVVMQSMEFAIKLSAFVLVRVNEAESVAFSDFEFAGSPE